MEILFFLFSFSVKVNKDANPFLFQKTDETFDLSWSTVYSSTDPKILLFWPRSFRISKYYIGSWLLFSEGKVLNVIVNADTFAKQLPVAVYLFHKDFEGACAVQPPSTRLCLNWWPRFWVPLPLPYVLQSPCTIYIYIHSPSVYGVEMAV